MSFIKSLKAKYQVLSTDEEDQEDRSDEEDQEDRSDEDDIFLSDTGPLGSHTSVSAGGKHIGNFKSYEDAEKAIVNWINKNKWQPNIWQVSDHGNEHRYELGKKYQKMIKM